MKAAKRLLEEGNISVDVILMADEMYLQQECKFQGRVAECGSDENLIASASGCIASASVSTASASDGNLIQF